jgi:hypothetical protein
MKNSCSSFPHVRAACRAARRAKPRRQKEKNQVAVEARHRENADAAQLVEE